VVIGYVREGWWGVHILQVLWRPTPQWRVWKWPRWWRRFLPGILQSRRACSIAAAASWWTEGHLSPRGGRPEEQPGGVWGKDGNGSPARL